MTVKTDAKTDAKPKFTRFFTRFKQYRGMSFKEIIHSAGLRTSVASLQRYFEDELPWPNPVAWGLAQYAAGILECSLEVLWMHLTGGLPHQLPWQIEDVESSKFLHPNRYAMDDLLFTLFSYERNSIDTLSVRRSIPVDFMPQEAQRLYHRALAQRSGEGVDTVEDALNRFGHQRHEIFLNDYPYAPGQYRAFMLRSDLEGMVHRRWPFNLWRNEHVQMCLETLIYDAIEERGVVFGLLDEMSPETEGEFIQRFGRYESVSFIGTHICMRREWANLTRALQIAPDAGISALPEGSHWKSMYAYAAHDLPRYVPDGDRSSTMRSLQELIPRIPRKHRLKP